MCNNANLLVNYIKVMTGVYQIYFLHPHSFRAFLIETPHLRFRTKTHLGRNRQMGLGVLTVKGRDPAVAVMFTRATPGCGTLAGPGPSLKLEGFLSLKFKGSASSPGLIRPSALP